MLKILGLPLALALIQPALKSWARDVLDYVDPFIGTSQVVPNTGHVFPGATRPYSMAKAGVDMVSHYNHSAWILNRNQAIGFSHLHDYGIGGKPSLGNFPIWPLPECPENDRKECEFRKRKSMTRVIDVTTAKSSPGYFAVTLENGIEAEMTVSEHTALYKFKFPQHSSGDNLHLNPVIVQELKDLNKTQKDGNIHVDPQTGRITGWGEFAPSFGIGTYKSYFCTNFLLDQAKIRDVGTFDVVTPGGHVMGDMFEIEPGAWVRFNVSANREISVRVGLSFVSIDKACQNAIQEIPYFRFEETRTAAESAWRQKLSTIQVDNEGVSDELQTVLYSGIYRSLISPQDYTGENALWNSTEPYFDSYYCLWDTFRTVHPLITLIDPQSQVKIVKSLIDIYRHEGKLPDCRMSLCKGYTKGGSNADIVLVDTWLKGFGDNVDWDTA